MAQTNRWHAVMLPDDYLRKLKQDLAEAEAQVEAATRYEPDPDFSSPSADEWAARLSPFGYTLSPNGYTLRRAGLVSHASASITPWHERCSP